CRAAVLAAAARLAAVFGGHGIRQPDDELAALAAPFAARLDGAVVHADQRANEAQADAEAALRSLERMVDLHEGVEDLRQHVARDADAVVLDADHHVGALALDAERDVAA